MISPENSTNRISEYLTNSVIVCAHPDDEILWFGSILKKVDSIIICYRDNKSEPLWSAGRRKSLSEYPMKNVNCLNIDESNIFNDANWLQPKASPFGMSVVKNAPSPKDYIENFEKIMKALTIHLSKAHNVFTHNPWGEYGNEEHIQLFTIVKKLRDSIGFNLWFPNYCSTKSHLFMSKYLSNFGSKNFTLQTDMEFSETIMNLYRKNNCWTWYDKWEWAEEETFIQYSELESDRQRNGAIIPINLIKVEPLYIPDEKPSLMERALKRLRRLMSGKK